MGILASIFGSTELIKSGFELIDSMHTSDEEEIQARVRGKVELLGAYSAFKIAQRVLAFMFVGVYLICFAISLYMVLFGGGKVDDIVDLMAQFYIGEITLSIVLFYFGGGFLEGTITKAKRKPD